MKKIFKTREQVAAYKNWFNNVLKGSVMDQAIVTAYGSVTQPITAGAALGQMINDTFDYGRMYENILWNDTDYGTYHYSSPLPANVAAAVKGTLGDCRKIIRKKLKKDAPDWTVRSIRVDNNEDDPTLNIIFNTTADKSKTDLPTYINQSELEFGGNWELVYTNHMTAHGNEVKACVAIIMIDELCRFLRDDMKLKDHEMRQIPVLLGEVRRYEDITANADGNLRAGSEPDRITHSPEFIGLLGTNKVPICKNTSILYSEEKNRGYGSHEQNSYLFCGAHDEDEIVPDEVAQHCLCFTKNIDRAVDDYMPPIADVPDY